MELLFSRARRLPKREGRRETFGARLRNEVDLDQLSVDLMAVVHETVEPAHASLWFFTEAKL